MCASSPYFKALLAGPLRVSATEKLIIIESVNGGTLHALIEFCYTGHLHIDDDNVDDLIGAASLLQCHRVEEMCADYLMGQLDTGNCLGLWQLAVQYELTRLKAAAMQLILNDFDVVITTDEFAHLHVDALRMLLAYDGIFVWSEEEIFEACIRWIMCDECGRSMYFGRLLVMATRLPQLKMEVRDVIVIPFVPILFIRSIVAVYAESCTVLL